MFDFQGDRYPIHSLISTWNMSLYFFKLLWYYLICAFSFAKIVFLLLPQSSLIFNILLDYSRDLLYLSKLQVLQKRLYYSTIHTGLKDKTSGSRLSGLNLCSPYAMWIGQITELLFALILSCLRITVLPNKWINTCKY